MIFKSTTLEGAFIVEMEPRGDDRGFFARVMCRDEFEAHGLIGDFPQINMSYSVHKGTLRGLHYQVEPHGEAKLVRCLRGAVMDVIVDMRPNSPTFRKHEQFELTADNRRQLYVPPGFAHGFLTLVDDAEVTYPVSARYEPSAERGVRYDDPALGIKWPVPVVHVSPKDATWPLLSNASGDTRQP